MGSGLPLKSGYPLLFESYGDSFSWIYKQHRVNLKITTTDKLVVLSYTFIKLPNTVDVLKQLLSQNPSIKTDDFVTRFLGEGSYNWSGLLTSTTGRKQIGKSLGYSFALPILGALLGLGLFAVLIYFLTNL